MGIIENLPSYDELKLIAIEKNAERALRVGDSKQKKQAEEVLAAIESERIRRQGDDYVDSDSAADAEFEAVWLRIKQRLNPPITIQNWGIDQQFTGGSFQLEVVADTWLRVNGTSMSKHRDISKGDFAKVYRVWQDYCSGNYSRADLGKLSQNTTYILSIFKRII